MEKEIISKATYKFIQFGFKSFTIDDLASDLGISKKTLYNYYPSKEDLIEACLEDLLEKISNKAFLKPDGSIIEQVFFAQKCFFDVYKVNSVKPFWELKKYYPKLHKKFDEEFKKYDEKQITEIIQMGLQQGFFREDIDIPFVKAFFHGMIKMREIPDVFPEHIFPFYEVLRRSFEVLFRFLSNEKGIKELERVLKMIYH